MFERVVPVLRINWLVAIHSVAKLWQSRERYVRVAAQVLTGVYRHPVTRTLVPRP